MRVRATQLALLVLGWLGTTGPAGAVLFCNVLESPDGFVALRVGPRVSAQLVTRMRAGDEVLILHGRRGGWEEVYHWRGNDRFGDATRDNKRHGWVNSRYIADICG